MSESAGIRVDIITGFLGSGKTTLLRRILSSPSFSNAAVLINEAGEEGLDHLLIERLDETSVLLANGCICCTVRDDLKRALITLFDRRTRGEVPFFNRVIIETTGLADPAPIVATLMRDMALRHHYRLGFIVATFDAVHGHRNLRSHVQIARQLGMADLIVLTKADLVHATRVRRLRQAVRRINASALVHAVTPGELDTAWLEGIETSGNTTAWLARLPKSGTSGRRITQSAPTAGPRVASFLSGEPHALPSTLCIKIAEPIEWTAFGLWLSLLIHRHAERILRIKGLVQVEGSETPVIVHGVQSLLHPAEHLSAWPPGIRETRLVFITQGLNTILIRRSLETFLAAALPQLRETMQIVSAVCIILALSLGNLAS